MRVGKHRILLLIIDLPHPLAPSASLLRATSACASGLVPGDWDRKRSCPRGVRNLVGKSKPMHNVDT